MIKIQCRSCRNEITLTPTSERMENGAIVYIDPKGRRQIGTRCRDCVNAKKRDNWTTTGLPEKFKEYERTEFGCLMRKYRNMLSRIKGVQGKKKHLYLGKEILSKEEFYRWAELHPDFRRLFQAWVNSGYDRKLAPSVDRIDPDKGYVVENMRWITHSENSSRAAKRKRPFAPRPWRRKFQNVG